jgi:hypothetical protein
LSDHDHRARPAGGEVREAPQPDEPKYLGGSVGADRAWAQNRIANFMRGQRYGQAQAAQIQQTTTAAVQLSPKGAGGTDSQAHAATLRQGGTVRVKTVEEARAILEKMPELRPATEERKMPNPERKLADGFEDAPGTYRGDLINKQKPDGPIHPGVKNPEHANMPHYNIKLPNGKKAAIIITG